jgi:putative transposase
VSPRWAPDPDARTGRHVVHNLHVHLVFVTKYRRNAFNGEHDHIHLLVHYPPRVRLSELVNSLKGVSSRRLRQEYTAHVRRYLWGGHFWSGSNFAGSCGEHP